MTVDGRAVGMCVAALLPDPMVCDLESFAAIARATADAGFETISLWPMHARAVGFERAAEILAGTGLRMPVVEAAMQWSRGDTPELRAEIDEFVAAAERFGARIAGACMLEPRLASLERAAEGFGILCEALGRHGLQVSLEFLPWTGVPDLATAWRIVEAAGSAYGGILLDTWHWQRQPGGPAPDLLRRIPGERISYLQLCDCAALPAPDAFTEAMTDRRLPGQGSVDFGAVQALLDEIGATPFAAAEIFSAELLARGTGQAARAMRRACSDVLRR